MLEKPDIQDEKITACLKDNYGLSISQITFLPLGADAYAAVYRAVAADGVAYFVKLKRGAFDEIGVLLPKCLHDQGIKQVVAPLATITGQLWATIDSYKLILYPFIDGRNGYQTDISERNWAELGRALKSIHTATLPQSIRDLIPHETYSPRWRDEVKIFLDRAEIDVWQEPIANKTAAFLRGKHVEIFDLLERTDRLAQILLRQPPNLVVCHSDIHAANILIDAKDNLYIVDWDAPILGPKERDLMFPGGGQYGMKRSPEEEERLFYRGYGQTNVNLGALAYYRCERIIEDIAAYSEQLLLTDEGGQDRERGFHHLSVNFEPGNTIDLAYREGPFLNQSRGR